MADGPQRRVSGASVRRSRRSGVLEPRVVTGWPLANVSSQSGADCRELYWKLTLGERATLLQFSKIPTCETSAGLHPTASCLIDGKLPDRPFSNLWEIDVDPRKMKAQGKPRRLTNWAGFAIGAMSASRDGKRLAVTKRLDQSEILIGELADRGDRLDHLRRMGFDDRVEWPGGWSTDSKWLPFQSDRTGNMSIFRLRAGSSNPEPLVTNQDDNWAPLLSPDGQWVLYLAWPRSTAQTKTGRLMRMPAGGGSPELILEARGFPGSAQTSSHVVVPTTIGHPAFRCPSQTGASCVLSEAGAGEVVFQSFDPLPSAAKSELFRIQVKDPNLVAWDLSPDGSRVAWCARDLLSASIHIRELGRGTTRDIPIPRMG